ncbi:MAG: GTP-binding protein, partial [Acutalibacteraceae bacterium]
MQINKDQIRNFCIIAHIDHGKSTLADRLLEATKSVEQRQMTDQLLDSMDLERERGITIKSHPVTLYYNADDGKKYELNLIDTPGHVDFNYEVSRSLAACEGALLVVDASQGIEAQTLANTYLALDHDLEIVPVINKIDLASADPDKCAEDIENIIGIEAKSAPRVSAKSGINIEQVLEAIVKQVPAPQADDNKPLKALIFDSYYDAYKGVIVYFRVVDGVIKTGMNIKMMSTGAQFNVVEVGRKNAISMEPCDELRAGEVGYIAASIKNAAEARVGDTITSVENGADEPLPGYRQVNPVVFCGIYPADGAQYTDLREALEKLQLNDAAL